MKKLVPIIGMFILLNLNNSSAQTGKAIVLDGSTNYITVPNDVNLNVISGESKSVTFWMKTSSATGGYYIVAKRPSVAPSPGYEIIMNAARIQANVRNTDGKDHQTPYGTASLADNKWHHLAFVFDQTGATLSTILYLDGVQNAVSVTAPNFAPPVDLTNTENLIIGARSNLSSKFNGSLDNVRIWNKAMTVTEVVADMTSSVGSTTPNLVAAWDFENVASGTVPDISGNGHNGTVTGTVVLPIDLISFNGVAKGNIVDITWSTASEKDNNYFEIERSTDGAYFATILKVDGATNSNLKKDYHAIDLSPQSGTNYYRLKQVDLNGKYTVYDKVLAVSVLSGYSKNQKVYPNPAKDFLVVEPIQHSDDISFELFDLNGAKQNISFTQRENQFIINTKALSKGVYILKTINNHELNEINKIIIDN